MSSARRCIRALLVVSLAAGGAGVQGAAAAPPDVSVRLLDLNRTGQSGLGPYFDPLTFVDVGGMAFFTAWSISEGAELWRSDGTEPGTRLVADLLPGTLSSTPGQLTPARDGSRLFFLAVDDTGAYQIYAVRSPSLVLARLTSFDPAALGTPELLGTAGVDERTLVFSYPIAGGAGRIGLFAVRDETQPPALLRVLDSGPIGIAFGGSDVAASSEYLYFAADDGIHGRELWRTDGTAAGTGLMADVVPGPMGSNPSAIAPVGSRVFFSATTPAGGAEPWVCEAGGARMVADIESGLDPSLSSVPSGFAPVNGRLVFSAQTASAGRELWSTDAAANTSATVRLRDINPGPASGLSAQFESALVGGLLYFAADDGFHGTELWSTDGTAAGTRMVAELRSGAEGSAPAAFRSALAGSVLLFQAAADDGGYRLWRGVPRPVPDGGIDLVVLSEMPLSDDAAVNRLTTRPIAVLGERLVYPAFRLDCGLELFRSAIPAPQWGAAAELVKDIRAGTSGSAPAQFAPLGAGGDEVRGVIFSARNEFGSEPWVSDGYMDGTRMLGDLAPGRTGSNPASLIPGRDFTIFRATTGGVTTWWRTDAASPGALPSGAMPLGISEPVQAVAPRAAALDGLTIFAGRTLQTGDEPFVTDSVQTRLLADIGPGARGSSPFYFFRLGNRVLFFASRTLGTAELWSTGGTPETTEHITTLVNPTRPRVISPTVRPVVAGPRLFFVADDERGDELWSTNGTEEGTVIAADIIPGPRSSLPANLCASLGPGGTWRLFFAATDDEAGAELWMCTSESTPDFRVDPHRVADIVPGPGGSAPFSLTAEPGGGLGRVYFVATDGASGFELWSSDGTADSAVRMTDVHASANQAVQSVLGIVGDRVYLRIVDPGFTSLSGQLFMADASPAGASPVLNPAGEPVVPTSNIVVVNNRGFIAVSDVVAGAELAVLDFCRADFDNSGSTSVDDMFSFLASWIPAVGRSGPGLGADFTGDDRIGVDDLFEFLARYFDGCS